MKMNLKNKLIAVIAVVAMALFVFAGVCMNNKTVYAESINPTEFYMQEGAEIKADSDQLGIRFTSTLTSDYWTAVVNEYGKDATYRFYSIVSDGTKDIRKDYGQILPDFTSANEYSFYSTVLYNTQELESAGLLDEARSLSLSATTYLEVVKAGQTTPLTIPAHGETGSYSMRAVANATLMAGVSNEELNAYVEVGFRSEEVEGYVFGDGTGIITMANMPVLTDTTDLEVYYGTEKLTATYKDGEISFNGVSLAEGQTEVYISAFAGGKVYSSKASLATKIAQANASDLLTLKGNETVVLAEDIDLASITWNSAVTFSGVFDGNGFAVKNLTTQDKNGFFKNINGATIKNVAFTNVKLTANGSGSGGLTYQPAGPFIVENVFMQITSVFSGGRPGAIFERNNKNVSVTLTNVVIYMPNTNGAEAILGYTTVGEAGLNNVHVINLPNENASITSVSSNGTTKPNITSKSTYTFHADIATFATTKTTLTPFLDACVDKYFNIVKVSQTNVGKLLTLKGNETVYLSEDIDLKGITWNSAVTFSGTFDGGNHVVKNLTVESNNGFFKNINGATIKNVGFADVDLSKGNNGALTYQPSGSFSVNNVFIEVVSTNAGGRVGAICERSTSANVIITLTDVVISMPNRNSYEAICGFTIKGYSTWTNVHCIGLPNESASVGNVAGNGIKGTYTLHPDLATFNSATKTLTAFLTSCVDTYLNAKA